jgi:hypothetical protein
MALHVQYIKETVAYEETCGVVHCIKSETKGRKYFVMLKKIGAIRFPSCS